MIRARCCGVSLANSRRARRQLFFLDRLEVVEQSVDPAPDGCLAFVTVFLASELEAQPPQRHRAIKVLVSGQPLPSVDDVVNLLAREFLALTIGNLRQVCSAIACFLISIGSVTFPSVPWHRAQFSWYSRAPESSTANTLWANKKNKIPATITPVCLNI